METITLVPPIELHLEKYFNRVSDGSGTDYYFYPEDGHYDGWGGVPGSGTSEEAREMFKRKEADRDIELYDVKCTSCFPAPPQGDAPTAPTLDEAYWDDNARQCGNCSVEIIARGGTLNKHGLSACLSDPGDSEDESLCGACAGDEMYRLMDENDHLRASEKALRAERDRLKGALERAPHDGGCDSYWFICEQAPYCHDERCGHKRVRKPCTCWKEAKK